MIYGTCSVLSEENEDVVRDFLSRHGEFEVLGAERWVPASVVREGFLRTFPHRHNTDGFFGAVLGRKKEPPSKTLPLPEGGEGRGEGP